MAPPTTADPLPAAPLPQRIGRYIVQRQLGEGGMGVVYAVLDEQLGRTVALKLLHAGDPAGVRQRRVLREAQAMARVSHRAVVPIFEVGHIGEQIFIAMEYIDGYTLTRWVERTRPPWRELVRLYCQAGEGLLAAHRAGLVHRDFKPDNVLIDREGQPRVADFGLARLERLEDAEEAAAVHAQVGPLAETLTRAGAISGTPRYMSPEQLRGEAIDARSDQFSFCVALYIDLFGEHPFPGGTVMEVAQSVVEGRLRPPPSESAVPDVLRAVVLRGLALRPEERYPSMAELLGALRQATQGENATGRALRRLVGATVAALTLLFVILGRPGGAPMPMRHLVLFAVLANGVCWSAYLALRRIIPDQQYQGQVGRQAAMYTTAMLAFRLLGLAMGLSAARYFPFDLLLAALYFAIMAERAWPLAWPLCVGYLAVAFAAGLRPDLAQRLAGLTLPQIPLWVALLWARSVRHRERSALRLGDQGRR